MITIDAMSELGTRKNQQDSYLYRSDEDITFAVVCDGMGGMNGGDVASRSAVLTLKEDLCSKHTTFDIPEFLKQEVTRLDKIVFGLIDERRRPLGAGTTIAAAILRGNQLFWLTVGDSEIFVIRGNEIVAVNQKHNYQLQLDEMFIHGKISREVYEVEQARGAQLISFLGMGNVALYDINDRPLLLQKGDYICICSDGVTNTIVPEELLKLVKANDSVEDAVKSMVSRIRRKSGNQDNATAILIKYH